MNAEDLIPVLLLATLIVAVGAGALIVLLIRNWRRIHRASRLGTALDSTVEFPDPGARHPVALHRPNSWLVVRSRHVRAVQSALRLHNVKPCTWTEGFANDQKVFVAPPVNGWILIAGSGLPDPADDVDASFRFLQDLSRKLGQVQYFSANRILGHHAWVRAEAGRIVRAYAWAGRTLWNQGVKTGAELDMGMKCFQYLESPDDLAFDQSEVISANVEKVPLLAARWSFDPASIDQYVLERACGVAGEAPRRY